MHVLYTYSTEAYMQLSTPHTESLSTEHSLKNNWKYFKTNWDLWEITQLGEKIRLPQ